MTPQLTPAAVAFLLEHQHYPGCTMASLTIRERLEVIEAEAIASRDAEIRAGVDKVLRSTFDGTEGEGWRLVLMSEDGGVMPGPLPDTFVSAFVLALLSPAAEPPESGDTRE